LQDFHTNKQALNHTYVFVNLENNGYGCFLYFVPLPINSSITLQIEERGREGWKYREDFSNEKEGLQDRRKLGCRTA
jgi:hypothetical protein